MYARRERVEDAASIESAHREQMNRDHDQTDPACEKDGVGLKCGYGWDVWIGGEHALAEESDRLWRGKVNGQSGALRICCESVQKTVASRGHSDNKSCNRACGARCQQCRAGVDRCTLTTGFGRPCRNEPPRAGSHDPIDEQDRAQSYREGHTVREEAKVSPFPTEREPG